ncbi:MAG: DsrE family protein [Candidatus Coatesbacteria bacterium]|nr:MAG: DsrE family protein [Candidatus Coatesbacteria bacterium]
MKLLILVYHDPYDGGDVVWNAMRVAAFHQELGDEVFVFLMSDAVTLPHADTPQPDNAAYDVDMEFEVAGAAGAAFKTCGTCLKNRALPPDRLAEYAPAATLKDLADWVHLADRILTF